MAQDSSSSSADSAADRSPPQSSQSAAQHTDQSGDQPADQTADQTADQSVNTSAGEQTTAETTDQASESGSDAAETGANVAQNLTERIDGLRDLMPDPVLAVWDTIAQFPIIGSAVIAVFGYIAAKIAVWLMRNTLNQLAKRTRTSFDDQLIALLRRPVFVTIFLFFLVLAIRPLTDGGVFFNIFGNVMASVVILAWLMCLLPASKLMLNALGRNHDRFPLVEERTIPLFNMLAMLLSVGIGAYALLILWGINPAAWLASAGVLGIAIGFAARDTLANLFAGVFIVADSPYKIGDFVNLDSGERGQVTSVGLRSTRLLTRDDVEITIPNAVIANAKIINETGGANEKSRIRIKVGVAYGTDVDQVVEVLEQVANDYQAIARSPTPRVRMRGFGDSSLDFELLCWINVPVDRGKVTHELYMAVYKRFAKENIEIPFPQRDLYVRGVPEHLLQQS